MAAPPLDDLPGFRRRIVVAPEAGRVRSDLEDDYHRMSVTIDHADGVARCVTGDMSRVPWTTCPGAQEVVSSTFTGMPLRDFAAAGQSKANCTHLYDLALIGAAHADACRPIVFDILVSDPVDGTCRAELRRDAVPTLRWTLQGEHFIEPAVIAGLRLDQLRAWIASLDDRAREEARLLRWGTMLAHGRSRSGHITFDKSLLPLGQCFTFQPANAAVTAYVPGTVRDFSPPAVGPVASPPHALSSGAESASVARQRDQAAARIA